MSVSAAITALCCAVAFLGAFAVRFDLDAVPETHRTAMWIGLPLVVLIRMLVLSLFNVHRGLYRYVSLHDFVKLVKAVSLGTLCFAVVWFAFFNTTWFMPRSIYLLEGMLSMGILVGLRVGVRLWRSRRDLNAKEADGHPLRRTLIIGAGDMGEQVLRMIDWRFLGQDHEVVGFVDDGPSKHGGQIHGVRVLGRVDAIPSLVTECDLDMLVFAISNPPHGLLADVIARCEGLNVAFNTVSVLQDVGSGEVSVERMRRVQVEDLLGRKPVKLDPGPVRDELAGAVVMVTGAGGSIGSELCRQLASFGPQRLILLECGETPLFEIDQELRRSFPGLDIKPIIGDIKHADVVERVFREEQPEMVYHAAAYKHVPLMEGHPDEAVLNNVRGTRFLAESARRHRCKRFVMISSDKAVRPTNVMGATKRMCELVIQSMNGGDTVFAAVRFGNVLGSNGSVIPIFRKQLDAGGPLTVTDPEMTRYFMTIPEAVSLVLQCGTIAEPADVFVLDMGTPVKIMDLARNMIRLSGLTEGVDASIEITGLRPGEKMYEELVAYGEELQPTRVPKVNVLKQQCNGFACDLLFTMIYKLEELGLARESDRVRALLWRLIDMDNDRAQGRLQGLVSKSVHGLIHEWRETVASPSVPITGKTRGRVMAVLADLALEPVLSDIMTSIGYELDCLSSREEALGLLASHRAYSVILCDFILPSGTAVEFRDAVQQAGHTTPVLAMSMYDHKALAELLEMDQSMPVLIKPFSVKLFEKKLAELALPGPVG